MLNEGAAVSDDVLNVLEGIKLVGGINTTDEQLLSNVRSSIRLGYPQIRPQAPNMDRVVIVGSGPSLESTFDELKDLVYSGAKLVTVNGAYSWCIERNLQPRTQIVMDARASNSRFLNPPIPHCRYVLASQCHPETWQMVSDRSDVWIWHAAVGTDGDLKDLLDQYYLGQWFGVGGGTTVVSRAISLLRTLGYLRFDLFGVDSCWMDDKHHAFEQKENEADRKIKVTVAPTDRPDLARDFWCAPWHMKQVEDFAQMVRVNGDHFLLNIHGDGLLAYMFAAGAACITTSEGV